MATLYSRTGATAHKDPEHGLFEPNGDGAFDFPDDLSDLLLRHHVGKRRMWEDEEMRADRLHEESEQRHRDPAVLYAAVTELVQLSRKAQGGGTAPDLAAEMAQLRAELAELRESSRPAPGGDSAPEAGNAARPKRSPAKGDADPA